METSDDDRSGEVPSPATPPTILIVEDELMVALEMQALIEEAGLGSAQTVGTAAAALETLSELERLGAVILDVNLSDGDCLSLAADLQKKRVPFAFVTGYGADAEFLSDFADVPLIEKPFEAPRMLAAVRSLLDRKGTGSTCH